MALLKEPPGNSEPVNRRCYHYPQPISIAKKWWLEPDEQRDASGGLTIIQMPLGIRFA